MEVAENQAKLNVSKDIGLSSSSLAGVGKIRTFFIFLDLPVHYEFRVDDLPIFPEGTIVDMDLDLKDPRSERSRSIRGRHVVLQRKLMYTTKRCSKMGLTQYLEWKSVGSSTS